MFRVSVQNENFTKRKNFRGLLQSNYYVGVATEVVWPVQLLCGCGHGGGVAGPIIMWVWPRRRCGRSNYYVGVATEAVWPVQLLCRCGHGGGVAGPIIM